MYSSLPSYLSLRYESEEEQKYIAGLIDQFEYAKMAKSYHLALFAYHLLFMVFVYQTVFKIKIWMPDRFSDALIQSPADKRKQYVEATSAYAFVEIPERSVFELLNLLKECEATVSKCKKQVVDYRNNNLGHVNLYVVSEEEFENKTEEYEQIALEIHQLTRSELARLFNEYFESVDRELEQTKDDIEISLIGPNRMSDKDLECLAVECLMTPDFKKDQVSRILQGDFGIYVELSDIRNPDSHEAVF